jgi:hypothetical protein
MAARHAASRSAGPANAGPPPCTYTMESGFGVFSWHDPAAGTARYVDGGDWVRRTIRYLATVPAATDRSILYYAFAESEPEPDGRTRKWLFEADPRPNQTLCTVCFYFDQNRETLTFVGGATKTGAPPHVSPNEFP